MAFNQKYTVVSPTTQNTNGTAYLLFIVVTFRVTDTISHKLYLARRLNTSHMSTGQLNSIRNYVLPVIS
jgi:hypothetical protein